MDKGSLSGLQIATFTKQRTGTYSACQYAADHEPRSAATQLGCKQRICKPGDIAVFDCALFLNVQWPCFESVAPVPPIHRPGHHGSAAAPNTRYRPMLMAA